jgi:hypothetical protein
VRAELYCVATLDGETLESPTVVPPKIISSFAYRGAGGKDKAGFMARKRNGGARGGETEIHALGGLRREDNAEARRARRLAEAEGQGERNNTEGTEDTVTCGEGTTSKSRFLVASGSSE